MALDIPPPRQVLTHAHWTLGREKMAKSTGNVVNPFFALDRFGVETIRYYLAHDGNISNDSDYGNEYIIERYKKGLQGGLGNLTSRILRGKKWSVPRAVQRAARGELDCRDGPAAAQQVMLQGMSKRYAEKMNAFDVGGAVKDVMSSVYTVSHHALRPIPRSNNRQTNAFLQHSQPWDLIKSGEEAAQTEVDRIVWLSAEAIRITAICMQPIIPIKMAELLNMLGVDPSRRTFTYADFGADDNYGKSMVDLGRGHEGTLFPPLGTEN